MDIAIKDQDKFGNYHLDDGSIVFTSKKVANGEIVFNNNYFIIMNNTQTKEKELLFDKNVILYVPNVEEAIGVLKEKKKGFTVETIKSVKETLIRPEPAK